MSRITVKQARQLYTDCDLHELGQLAHQACCQQHRQPVRTYVVDRNINYTNICISGCRFCKFFAKPTDPARYVLTDQQLFEKIEQLRAAGGNQILLQGGLHPDLKLDWYCRMLKAIKGRFADLHIHGFSPPEIVHIADVSDSSIDEALAALRDAGLDTIPGGGAEILSDKVRSQVSPHKCSADQWLDVMRQAHQLGIRSTATMMFGHIESLDDRLEHLDRIRQLQDLTGGFTAFIPWTFQPGTTAPTATTAPTTALAESCPPCPNDRPCQPDGKHLHLAGSTEYLRMLAISRLFLDNVPNIQASWVTQGEKIAQLALFYGANDLGSTMMEENVVAAAGVSFRLSEQQIRHIIKTAGYEPRRRNCYYQLVD